MTHLRTVGHGSLRPFAELIGKDFHQTLCAFEKNRIETPLYLQHPLRHFGKKTRGVFECAGVIVVSLALTEPEHLLGSRDSHIHQSALLLFPILTPLAD